jgi:hypothetical protein
MDRRLAAQTFGGDPTSFETMTHHDAVKQFPIHAPGLSPSIPWNDRQKLEDSRSGRRILASPDADDSQPINELRILQTGDYSH